MTRDRDETAKIDNKARPNSRKPPSPMVNVLLREQKQDRAGYKELDAAITASTKKDQTTLPIPEVVVTKVSELRDQAKARLIEAKKGITKKINESFSTLPSPPTVAETREWTTKPT